MSKLRTILFSFGVLFFIISSSGCNGAVSGSIQPVSEAPTAVADAAGNFWSPSRSQKTTTITAGGLRKYTAYISVGSSQVVAP